ncbi:hypothetical protein JQ628_22960 [Bradyrhizobium lablabi]|uniref:hypothetical protein n=1 Tax=Bradyrhizobium lablabi TaxID=722472 RepID=UPI001BA9692F|nr:hypothetical protein [Bradyrhizobium lablabi]MBR1124407.1 hypothetical protein [Bradyrhizobium lablabi]
MGQLGGIMGFMDLKSQSHGTMGEDLKELTESLQRGVIDAHYGDDSVALPGTQEHALADYYLI